MVVELVVKDKIEAVHGSVKVWEFAGERGYLVSFSGKGAVAAWKGGGYVLYVCDGREVKEIMDKRIEDVKFRV